MAVAPSVRGAAAVEVADDGHGAGGGGGLLGEGRVAAALEEGGEDVLGEEQGGGAGLVIQEGGGLRLAVGEDAAREGAGDGADERGGLAVGWAPRRLRSAAARGGASPRGQRARASQAKDRMVAGGGMGVMAWPPRGTSAARGGRFSCAKGWRPREVGRRARRHRGRGRRA